MNSSEPPRGDLPDVREIINLLSLKPLPEEADCSVKRIVAKN